MRKISYAFMIVVFFSFVITGCYTTRTYVQGNIAKSLNEEIEEIRQKADINEREIKRVKGDLEINQTDIINLKILSAEQNERIVRLSHTVQEEMQNFSITFQDEMRKITDSIRTAVLDNKKKLIFNEPVAMNELTLKPNKLSLEPTVIISSKSILFSRDGAKLSDKCKSVIDTFAEELVRKNKDIHFDIEGHTDNIGSYEYNLKLGESRAKEVQNYIHKRYGIPLDRLRVISYGETMPLEPNNTESNRIKNRRVVLLAKTPPKRHASSQNF